VKKRYSSSLTDAQWKVLASKLPESMVKRKRKWALKLVFDAILYVLKNGVVWDDLPKDFPPHDTVYYYFKTWRDQGLFELLNMEMSGDFRQRKGRERSPSAGIIDSQSSKSVAISHENTGFDAGKKVKGRKKHIIVDTLGLLLVVLVHPANVQDRDGARMLFERLWENRFDFPRLKTFFADGGYAGQLLDWLHKTTKRWSIQIVKRTDPHAFKILPKRWVVERTFAWLDWSRRLSKDYERRTDSTEAFVQLAMIRILAIRLAEN